MNHRTLILSIFVGMVFYFSACHEESPFEYPKTNDDLITIERGIWGNVWYWEGYFNPPYEFGTITPVEREIHVFERINLDSMENKDEYPFFSYVDSEFYASARSDMFGFYQVPVDTGSYDFSLFIYENNKYYAVEVSDSGYVQSVNISGTLSRTSLRMKNLNITTAASFAEF